MPTATIKPVMSGFLPRFSSSLQEQPEDIDFNLFMQTWISFEGVDDRLKAIQMISQLPVAERKNAFFVALLDAFSPKSLTSEQKEALLQQFSSLPDNAKGSIYIVARERQSIYFEQFQESNGLGRSYLKRMEAMLPHAVREAVNKLYSL